MRRWLIAYFGIYGGMHLWLLLVVRRATGHWAWWHAAVAVAMVAMLVSPMAGRRLFRTGRWKVSAVVRTLAYSWMAVLFWFVCLSLLAEGWNVLVRVADWQAAVVSPRLSLAGSAVVILAAVAWSLVEAGRVRHHYLSVRTPRLAPGSNPIRIVQVCDLHLAPRANRDRLRRVLDLVRQADGDLLVCVGDLLDGPINPSDEAIALLNDLRPPMGKFAVMGNHEFYAGIEASVAFHEAAGFIVLRGQSQLVADGRLLLVGVDDNLGRMGVRSPLNDESAALPTASGDGPAVVLLKHRPGAVDEAFGRFDLQLSGHTHGGQIFPFTFVVRLTHGFWTGLHDLGEGSRLFISRGSGTWGPSMRLLAPPEVTVITLAPEE